MNKISLEVNTLYSELQNKKLQLEKELELAGSDVLEKELNKKKKALVQLEKEIVKVKNKCRKNLVQIIKAGDNIVGSLEKDFTLNDPAIKLTLSKWARKRGHGFEKWFSEKINHYAKSDSVAQDLNLYCYRNVAGTFGFQPFDLVIYAAHKEPIFLECKASGIVENSKGLHIAACERRYINYTNQVQKDKLNGFINCLDPIMFYVFREELAKKIYFIKYTEVFHNADWLCKKQINLKEKDYYVLDYDTEDWPLNLYEELLKYHSSIINLRPALEK